MAGLCGGQGMSPGRGAGTLREPGLKSGPAGGSSDRREPSPVHWASGGRSGSQLPLPCAPTHLGGFPELTGEPPSHACSSSWGGRR